MFGRRTIKKAIIEALNTKRYIGLLCLLLFCSSGHAQIVAYSHDYNLSNDGWVLSTSTNGTWTRGSDVLNDGSDGTSYWHSSPSDYSDDAVLLITSPEFVLTPYSSMVLSLDVRYDTESEYDGMQIEYNDGGGWSVLGAVGDGFNWYNDSDVNAINDNEHGWSGDNGSWKKAVIGLPGSLDNNISVHFRIRFESDGSTVDTGVAFDNFLIIAGGTEISVAGNGVEILNGDTTPSELDNTDFYAVAETSGSKTKNYSITNILGGTLALIGGLPITISGTHAADFTVTQPVLSSLLSGESTTFSISFDPGGTGLRVATVTIANSDIDENPYTFDIQGTGVNAFVVHNFNSDNGWNGTPAAVNWTRGTSTFTEGADGSFWHLTNMANYMANTSAAVTSPILDFTGLTEIVLYLDIRYETEVSYDGFQVEYSDDGGTIWNRLGNIGEGVNWYNDTEVDAIGAGQDGWSGHNSIWQTAEIELPAVLEGNNDSRFRVVFESDGSSNDIGVAFDNFMISAGIADINVQGNGIDIVSGSSLPSYLNVTDFRNVDVTSGSKSSVYTIRNRGGGTLNLIGGTPVTISGTNAADFTVTSQPGSSALGYLESTTFTIAFAPGAIGGRTATVSIASDDGDEATYTFDIGGTGDNALVYHNFDASDEGWTLDGGNVNGTWLRGTGAAPLNVGASGPFWYTDPSNYNNDALVIIESPTIDLTLAINPLLSFDLRYDTEVGIDGAKIEYSDDDGTSWFDLGQILQGINWYNDTGVDALSAFEDGWSGDNGNWLTSEIGLPLALVGNSTVRIRVIFASNASVQDVGIAFDNFAIYGTVVSLPVELISFDGVWVNQAVQLDWVTGSESNNDYFNVQRSQDGTDFYDIGTVDGSGNSTSEIHYSFFDENPGDGDVLYYRLTQVDFDGTEEIHPVIKVLNNDRFSRSSFGLYPNPSEVGQSLFIELHDDVADQVKLTIMDLAGHTHFSSQIKLDSNQTVDISGYAPLIPGIYLIALESKGARQVQRLIIK